MAETSAVNQRLPDLHCNDRKGTLRETLHPAKFPICEAKMPKGMLGLRKQLLQPKKAVASVVKGPYQAARWPALEFFT